MADIIKYTEQTAYVTINDIQKPSMTTCYYISSNNVGRINGATEAAIVPSSSSCKAQLTFNELPTNMSAINVNITGYIKSPNISNTVSKSIEVRQSLSSVKFPSIVEIDANKSTSYSITYTISPTNSFIDSVSIQSYFTSIATISGNVITAKKNGSSVFTYTFKSGPSIKTGTFNVIVSNFS